MYCQLCNQLSMQAYVCQSCYHDLPGSPQTIHMSVRQQDPVIDHIFCPYLYQPPISTLIQQLKYHRNYAYSRLLAQLFCRKLKATASILLDYQQDGASPATNRILPEQIIAVPLHHNRLKIKGFNQSFEIARFICGILKQRRLLNYKICQRIINTPSQTGLNKKQRQENMHGAFAMTQAITYKHVVIIDDVLTTGSTASSLGRTLKEAGVQRVDLWAMAFAAL